VLGHNKLCELEDFADPSLRRYLEGIFARNGKRLLAFVPGREHRKAWEVGQAARALVDFGAAHSDANLLGVAAGAEETVFWLTNHARRVYATDLYLNPGGWEADAPRSMLTDPGEYATCTWNERHLVVQHMDARKLRYEDETFDGLFSSSSIEHFGELDDVHRALAEMWRVLKPGGVASLSTEYRLRGHGPGLPGTLMFDAAEVDEIIVRPFAWKLVEPLDLHLSDRTRATEVPLAEASGRYPHLVLREGELVFTSIHLALRKATH
jgi:Methyltransferase domain